MATTEPPKQRISVRGVILAALVVQALIAIWLFGRDMIIAWPDLRFSSQPSFDQPIRPGDQTRRYRPADMPLAPARDGNPARPYQSTGDMPTRLKFETDGGTVTLTGQIDQGDADRFADWLDTLPAANRITTVTLNSPGGSVRDALAIGRLLHEAALNTRMGPGDICLSACPYILAAGTTRSVHRDAQVGVHQHYFDTNTVLPAFLAVEDIQRGQGEVMTYLDEMGINPLLMQHALTTPPAQIYVLLPEELETYHLATEQPEG